MVAQLPQHSFTLEPFPLASPGAKLHQVWFSAASCEEHRDHGEVFIRNIIYWHLPIRKHGSRSASNGCGGRDISWDDLIWNYLKFNDPEATNMSIITCLRCPPSRLVPHVLCAPTSSDSSSSLLLSLSLAWLEMPVLAFVQKWGRHAAKIAIPVEWEKITTLLLELYRCAAQRVWTHPGSNKWQK